MVSMKLLAGFTVYAVYCKDSDEVVWVDNTNPDLVDLMFDWDHVLEAITTENFDVVEYDKTKIAYDGEQLTCITTDQEGFVVVANANGIEGVKAGDIMERQPDGRWFPTRSAFIYVNNADIESRVREDFESHGVTVLSVDPGGNVLKQGYSEVVVVADEAARQLATDRRYPTEGVMKWK